MFQVDSIIKSNFIVYTAYKIDYRVKKTLIFFIVSVQVYPVSLSYRVKSLDLRKKILLGRLVYSFHISEF